MDSIIKGYNDKAEKTIAVLKEDLNTVRAGRANAAILDKISAEYYGTPTPLKSLANISVPDPRTLQISPFDVSCISAIEKAINEANLGMSPSNDGKVIRLIVPQLTEERRKELTKTTKKEKDGEITEDELKRGLDKIQKTTDAHTKQIDEMIAKKDKDILEV